MKPVTEATSPAPVSQTPRLLLSAEEAATALNISRALVFRLLAARQIGSITIGRRRLIPLTAIQAFIAEREEGGAA